MAESSAEEWLLNWSDDWSWGILSMSPHAFINTGGGSFNINASLDDL